jgi:hypothetical protein
VLQNDTENFLSITLRIDGSPVWQFFIGTVDDVTAIGQIMVRSHLVNLQRQSGTNDGLSLDVYGVSCYNDS